MNGGLESSAEVFEACVNVFLFNVITAYLNVSGVTMQCSLCVAIKPFTVSLGFVVR